MVITSTPVMAQSKSGSIISPSLLTSHRHTFAVVLLAPCGTSITLRCSSHFLAPALPQIMVVVVVVVVVVIGAVFTARQLMDNPP